MVYDDADARFGWSGTFGRAQIDHEELSAPIPVSPRRVGVLGVIALVRLDIAEGKSDEIAIEVQRALQIPDAQLDLDQARGQELAPQALREHPAMPFEILHAVLALPLVRLRLAQDLRAAAFGAPEVRVDIVDHHDDAIDDERSLEPLTR